MRRLLYLVTVITLILLFGIALIGCNTGPSNTAIKSAVINYEQTYGQYWSQEDIEVLQVGKASQFNAFGFQLTGYPVSVKHGGSQKEYILYKNARGGWEATQL